MPHHVTAMTLLKQDDPAAFKKKLLEICIRHEGNQVHVAEDMGMGLSTVKRWLNETGLMREVKELREGTFRVRVARRRKIVQERLAKATITVHSKKRSEKPKAKKAKKKTKKKVAS